MNSRYKNSKIEINKQLCERYPYLIPKSIYTQEPPNNYDYSYTLCDDLPEGWKKLFLQMCEDIRQPLIDNNYLNDFQFSQIKEKYGEMRCYCFSAPIEVLNIITVYESLSNIVCQSCGDIAVYQTEGWISNLCEDCFHSFFEEKEDGYHKVKIDSFLKNHPDEFYRYFENQERN